MGGRAQHSGLPFLQCHPIILHGNHILTRLIIQTEHLWVLYAGPMLVGASLACQFHILRVRNNIHFIIRSCVICRRVTGQSRPQIMGQLPADQFSTGYVFDRVGVDHTGLIWIISGRIRKPIITKAYVALYVFLSVKAVHLKPVTQLTTAAFISVLRHIIARWGKLSIMWSDHGTNFVGAAREIHQLVEFINNSDEHIDDFCTT